MLIDLQARVVEELNTSMASSTLRRTIPQGKVQLTVSSHTDHRSTIREPEQRAHSFLSPQLGLMSPPLYLLSTEGLTSYCPDATTLLIYGIIKYLLTSSYKHISPEIT